ncbi:HAD-IA family hydrolase [Leptospira sp. 96542]|nr:HAD-IA family hydrolase [Leptospira sp. 96542]
MKLKSTNNKIPKVLIFDYDDTLVQTRKIRYETLKRMSSKVFGYTLETSEIDAVWGLPADEFLLNLFSDKNDNLYELWDIYLQFCAEDPNIPYDYVLQFIQKNSEKYRFGILTASSFKTVSNEIQKINLDKELFFKIQTAEETIVHKPNPAVFEPICKKLFQEGVTKSEILYIGDSPSDHKASTGFGISFLGMAHDNRNIDYFSSLQVPFVKNFYELENYFENEFLND